MRFANKIAIVTGAGQAISEVYPKALAFAPLASSR